MQEFHLNYFYHFIVAYHAAKFENTPTRGSWDKGFGPQLDQNCPFGPKEDFLGNFTLHPTSTYVNL